MIAFFVVALLLALPLHVGILGSSEQATEDNPFFASDANERKSVNLTTLANNTEKGFFEKAIYLSGINTSLISPASQMIGYFQSVANVSKEESIRIYKKEYGVNLSNLSEKELKNEAHKRVNDSLAFFNKNKDNFTTSFYQTGVNICNETHSYLNNNATLLEGDSTAFPPNIPWYCVGLHGLALWFYFCALVGLFADDPEAVSKGMTAASIMEAIADIFGCPPLVSETNVVKTTASVAGVSVNITGTTNSTDGSCDTC